MNGNEGNLFEIKENELIFLETCKKLQNHHFETPWKHCFPKAEETETEFICGVHDLIFSEKDEINNSENVYLEIHPPPSAALGKDNFSEEFELQLSSLQESLMNIKKIPASEHLKGIEILNNISLSQVSEVCRILQTAFSNEATLVAVFNAILNLEKSLSLFVANALVKHIIYPQVFQVKQNSSRTLLAAVLKFTELYPKPVIDEIIVPSLNQPSLETLQLETLLKMVKSHLANQHVSYCIKNILEHTNQNDNTFSILQNLIERKIHHENTLLETFTQKIDSWSLNCQKNVKFTKLIISILITYGSELDQQKLVVYDDIIKNNQTIMKKAAENVIKQVKT